MKIRQMTAGILLILFLLSGCGVQKPVPPKLPSVKSFSNITDLSKYIREEIQKDQLEIEFRYTGDSETMVSEIVETCGVFYITAIYLGSTYTIHVTEYPGDRIVDAYTSGDSSQLSADELEALNVARWMVETAKKTAKNDIELEIALHDMIAQRVTYCSDPIEIPNKNYPPRHLTVVGALLDGYANCQG